ncbi:MAG: glycoside hydrolase family 5 protein [Deltaproteobacteria bacterium]
MTRWLLPLGLLFSCAASHPGPPDGGASDGGGIDGGDGGALPLHTEGRFVVGASGQRVKLASVDWYGAESTDFVVGGLDQQDLQALVKLIASLGFNSVRLPFSNQLVETNPVVDPARLSANPALQGLRALDVYDQVVAALTGAGLFVILDDHLSDAGWCCSLTDGNTLWYNASYPEVSWLADWKTMAERYAGNPGVVGADLRNEPRGAASWGGGDPTTDWHAAAERGGNAVLGANPNLLVIVEGVNFALDLTGAGALPVQLSMPGRLVYEAHDYGFDHTTLQSASQLAQQLDASWGYLATPGQSYTAPIWVGEFGTCHGKLSCVSGSAPSQGFWFQSLVGYLAARDFDWGYWPINGTQSTGAGRTLGADESYGVLNATWDGGALPALTAALQSIEPGTQGP